VVRELAKSDLKAKVVSVSLRMEMKYFILKLEGILPIIMISKDYNLLAILLLSAGPFHLCS